MNMSLAIGKRNTFLGFFFFLGLLATVLIAVGTGPMRVAPAEVTGILLQKIGVSFSQFTAAQEAVVWNIRLPRVITGILVGMSLAVSGAALQGIFRNPLVDPGLIGISSGAALAVAAVVVLGEPLIALLPGAVRLYGLTLVGFGGGVAATRLVLYIADYSGRVRVANLLLAGIAVQAVTFAGIGLLQYLSSDQQLRMITFWMLGSLGGSLWTSAAAAGTIIVAATVGLLSVSRELNLLALGEREAAQLGVDIEKLKRKVVLLVTLSVGAAVSVSGIIGFVGLVVPHLARMLFGADHRSLLPVSVFLGAILMVFSDMVARTVVAPAELPIGVITSLIGGPFFIFLIMANRRLT